MTKLLEDAFARAAELPEQAQDDFARWLLNELDAESRWADLFAESGNTLTKLAEEALAERARGESQPLDPSKL